METNKDTLITMPVSRLLLKPTMHLKHTAVTLL